MQKLKETEIELRTLLQESIQREKIGKISREKLNADGICENLLKENAQLKVELRLAEFECKRLQSKHDKI